MEYQDHRLETVDSVDFYQISFYGSDVTIFYKIDRKSNWVSVLLDSGRDGCDYCDEDEDCEHYFTDFIEIEKSFDVAPTMREIVESVGYTEIMDIYSSQFNEWLKDSCTDLDDSEYAATLRQAYMPKHYEG